MTTSPLPFEQAVRREHKQITEPIIRGKCLVSCCFCGLRVSVVVFVILPSLDIEIGLDHCWNLGLLFILLRVGLFPDSRAGNSDEAKRLRRGGALLDPF